MTPFTFYQNSRGRESLREIQRWRDIEIERQREKDRGRWRQADRDRQKKIRRINKNEDDCLETLKSSIKRKTRNC